MGSFIFNMFVCLFVSVSVGTCLHTDAHTQARRGCWMSAVTVLESEAHSQLNWQQWALVILLLPATWPYVSAETQPQARAGIQTPGLRDCPALNSWVISLASVYYLFVYFERVFCSTGWPQTWCGVMGDIESVILGLQTCSNVPDFTHSGYRTACRLCVR